MREQAMLAIDAADVIVLVTEIGTGITAADQDVANMLLRCGKPVVLAVNKMDAIGPNDPGIYEFYNLGMGDPIAVSAVHGHGTGDLLDACVAHFPPETEDEGDDDRIKVAVIGKPNVGKSSLINLILGENRVIVADMPGTTTVFAANGEAVGALHGGENRVWVPLSEIPTDVQNAFIAAEDLRFYRHNGVDLYRLFGALWQDIRTFSYAQGASTITQQLIKLTHLTQTKTLSRKAQEIALALQLERKLEKERILEAYLNAVYFGHGAYGVEAAANAYFDKPASELTLAEGALLAGVIKSPSNYAPHLHPDKAVARRNTILDTMYENGFITESQRAQARGEALNLAMRDDDTHFAWYMDAVLAEASEALGLTADEAHALAVKVSAFVCTQNGAMPELPRNLIEG